MERPVKERLVGAAVLMAAAIILIPEMLSGPDRESPETAALQGQDAEKGKSSEGAIKTYTIDLSKSPGTLPSPVNSEGGDERAPPPEEVTPAEAPPPQQQVQVSPEPTPPTPAVVPEEKPPAPEPRQETPRPAAEPYPRQIAAQPARAEAPPEPTRTETPAPRAVASTPPAPTSPVRAASVPTTKGWAVQLASYASETTAGRIRDEWRAKGQDAFVMPVQTGGKTLYRVRIGPTKDRASSEAALKAVKPSIPGAAIVAHP